MIFAKKMKSLQEEAGEMDLIWKTQQTREEIELWWAYVIALLVIWIVSTVPPL